MRVKGAALEEISRLRRGRGTQRAPPTAGRHVSAHLPWANCQHLSLVAPVCPQLRVLVEAHRRQRLFLSLRRHQPVHGYLVCWRSLPLPLLRPLCSILSSSVVEPHRIAPLLLHLPHDEKERREVGPRKLQRRSVTHLFLRLHAVARQPSLLMFFNVFCVRGFSLRFLLLLLQEIDGTLKDEIQATRTKLVLEALLKQTAVRMVA
mmetsp:Transcript_45152/g.119819  ORF Transcript_45152/g.119819 Transcript_45152/m.119819 type:complete len:205 (+) Transcript_45152:1872-2486(+)